jgi:GNAT superfamily N-acetyltransferase
MTVPTPLFIILPATTHHLPSLTTIVPQSFHPTNPYILALLPNTPTIRAWWTTIFTPKIQSPATSHLLTATSATNPSPVLGILSMQLLGAEEHGVAFWSDLTPTADHDIAAYADVAQGLSEARERFMGGRPHFVIELFGVDHEAKGLGLGKMLLLRACEIADEAELAVFVMANASARGIYQHRRIGFELRDMKVLLGGDEEYMLVRPSKGSTRPTCVLDQ